MEPAMGPTMYPTTERDFPVNHADVESVWVLPTPGVQTPENRFGAGVRKRIYKALHSVSSVGPTTVSEYGDFDSYDSLSDTETGEDELLSAEGGQTPPSEPDHDPPRAARARLNLTALSQRYNLYFAVYESKIYVSHPRAAPEILRSEFVLNPPPSEAAKLVGGYINNGFGHQANHVVVGDFGDKEILVLAYDDGDVIAYYTHTFVDFINQGRLRGEQRSGRCPTASNSYRRASRSKAPRPFFHENVGKSAWGLAVHAKSRLIAVSANLAEVTVFAQALDQDETEHSSATDGATYEPGIEPMAFAHWPETGAGVDAYELEMHFRSRTRSWRILLPMGYNGTNMPSIAFSESADGEADKIIGVDIRGTTWFLDIWRIGTQPISLAAPYIDGPDNEPGGLHGWGTLVLPQSAFIKTRFMPVSPGIMFSNGGSCLSISRSMDTSCANDRTRPCLTPQEPFGISGPGTDMHREIQSLQYQMLPRRPFRSAAPWGRAGRKQAGTGSHDNSGSRNSDSCGNSVAAVPGIVTIQQAKLTAKAARALSGSTPLRLSLLQDIALRSWAGLVPGALQFTSCRPSPIDFAAEVVHGFQFGMMICPSLGLTWPDLSVPDKLVNMLNCRTSYHTHINRLRLDVDSYIISSREAGTANSLVEMASRFAILRTFSRSAQLFSTNLEEMSSLFMQLLVPPSGSSVRPTSSAATPAPLLLPPNAHSNSTNSTNNAVPLPWDMGSAYHRISMLHIIPELGLVVAGGMFGRVALLRLLSTDRHTPLLRERIAVPPRTFRLEWVLPRTSEDHLRPNCCLLGLAVSPVPEPGSAPFELRADAKSRSNPNKRPRLAKIAAAERAPRRWRLILHYMDHTILQYYIEEKNPKGNGSGESTGSELAHCDDKTKRTAR